MLAHLRHREASRGVGVSEVPRFRVTGIDERRWAEVVLGAHVAAAELLDDHPGRARDPWGLFERFTHRAREVAVLAHEEARALLESLDILSARPVTFVLNPPQNPVIESR